MKKIGKSFACKLCGKEFKSAVAVYGHMRCHSKRKAAAVVDQRYGLNAELMMQLSTPRKKRSGGRCRIKTSCSNNSSWCNMNTSCCFDNAAADEELLDIAASLLMLSKGGFCSADHVSDNDDDDSEPKFLTDSVDSDDDHVSNRVSGFDSGVNVDVLRSGCDSFKENSKEFDCGLLKNEADNIENGPVSDVEVQSELFDFESNKNGAIDVYVADAMFGSVNGNAFAPAADEMEHESDDRMLVESNVRTCAPTNQDNIGTSVAAHSGLESELSEAEIGDESRRVCRVDSMVEKLSLKNCEPVIEEGKSGKVGVADLISDECNAGTSEQITDDSCFKKCQQFVCSNCNKSFSSHQSLGGHRVHCRRLCHLQIEAHMKASIKSEITVSEKQGVEDGIKFGGSIMKKSWKHKCLVCCKTFPTGRALGGHMRAHFKGKLKSDDEVENVACNKNNVSAIEEDKEEENVADEEKFSVAVVEERQQENDACSMASTKVQQLLMERNMVIVPQGNIPLLA